MEDHGRLRTLYLIEDLDEIEAAKAWVAGTAG
jgi:hypothetical protein